MNDLKITHKHIFCTIYYIAVYKTENLIYISLIHSNTITIYQNVYNIS